MHDIIYVQLDIVYSINHQLNETISRKSYFFETVKSKVIISLFETVRLSVLISPRNLYNSLKSIKEKNSLPRKANRETPKAVTPHRMVVNSDINLLRKVMTTPRLAQCIKICTLQDGVFPSKRIPKI